jgi:hypothetical protein
MLFFIINFYFWENQFELNNMGSFGNFLTKKKKNGHQRVLFQLYIQINKQERHNEYNVSI